MADKYEFPPTPEMERALKVIKDTEDILKELRLRYRILELERKVRALVIIADYHSTKCKRLPKTDSSDEEW
jgi:hypothetical protein